MRAIKNYLVINKKILLITSLLLIMITNGFSQNSSSVDSIKNDPYSYPFLWDMIEDYYFFHYKMPENPKELVKHIERIDMFMYSYGIDNLVKKIVIPKLKANEQYVNFTQKDSVFLIQINDSTYEEKSLTNYPCDYIKKYEKDPYKPGYPFLIDNVLYFDENNQAIVKDSLIEKLNSKFKKIKYLIPEEGVENGFSFFKYYETYYPYRLFLEYTTDKGLYNFCTKEKVPDNKYYNEQAKLIKEFCVKNKLTKVIWFGFKTKE